MWGNKRKSVEKDNETLMIIANDKRYNGTLYIRDPMLASRYKDKEEETIMALESCILSVMGYLKVPEEAKSLVRKLDSEYNKEKGKLMMEFAEEGFDSEMTHLFYVKINKRRQITK